MNTAQANSPEASQVLSKALINAGKQLGISQTDIGKIIGKERTSLSRGINPKSKAGELALLLLRCYRSLFVLVGGDPQNIQHWMHTDNQHTGGVPAQQVQSITGLTRVLEYLDAMRGKV